MADDQTPSRSQADKEKSRQQNRPVSGRQAARSTTSSQPGRPQKGNGPKGGGTQTAGAQGKGTQGKGTQTKGVQGKGGQARGAQAKAQTSTRQGQRSPRSGTRPAPASRRSSASLLTWGTVGLVLIIVIALVIVHFASSSTPSAVSSTFVPVSDTVAHDVTTIPASVYNKVGITSSATAVNPPTIVHGQPPLTYNGKPGVYYFGAEYCPYCAAERWALIASLSRFGKFAGLGAMQSSSTDVFPNTPTFTFLRATLTSPYLTLKTQEYESNVPSATTGHAILQPFVGNERHLVSTYDTTKYFPSGQTGAFPFISIGNKAMIQGASYAPSLLAGLSRDQIAAGLSDPTNAVTQAIIATSNYISAGTCSITNQQPSSVCTSKGVMVAAKALHLSP